MNDAEVFRCFPKSHTTQDYTSRWYQQWQQEFEQSLLLIKTSQARALGRLIPLLLCGEQSANLVFSQEVERLADADNAEHIQNLKQIEADEYHHDLALQAVLAAMPQADDVLKIKRRAQKFYTQLGRSENLAAHFAQICHLDTCVTIIMSAMSHSDLGREHIISRLFELIRKDEARHVSICGEHIRYLGACRSQYQHQAKQIKQQLVELLTTEQAAFAELGVDSQQLFARILK